MLALRRSPLQRLLLLPLSTALWYLHYGSEPETERAGERLFRPFLYLVRRCRPPLEGLPKPAQERSRVFKYQNGIGPLIHEERISFYAFKKLQIGISLHLQ